MLILQIDASSTLCSVALAYEGNLLHMEINSEPWQHGRDINLLVDTLFEKTGYGFSDLNAVSVNKGPGSYTALRIGMSTAKGFCYGLDLPLIAPTGLEVLVGLAMDTHPDASAYVPMIDARRMEVYAIDPVADLSEPLNYKSQILTSDSYAGLRHENLCFIGNGVSKWIEVWPEKNSWLAVPTELNAGMMTRISNRFFQKDNISDLFKTAPIYIKKPHITQSKKQYFN